MSFFFRLPNTLSVNLLSAWICDLQDIDRLDSAALNTKERQHFLEIFQLDYVVFGQIEENNRIVKKFNLSFYSWIALRKIQLNEIYMSGRNNTENILRQIVFALTLAKLEKVTELIMGGKYDGSSYSNYLSLVIETKLWELLPNVKKLTVYQCGFSLADAVATDRIILFTELTDLFLNRIDPKLAGLELFKLFQSCKKIQRLNISESCDQVDCNESYVAFIKNNANTLEFIVAYCTWKLDIRTFDALGNHCRNLKSLEIQQDYLDTQSINNALMLVAENNPLIECINFARSDHFSDECLIAFATHCKLKQVKILECWELTDYSIQFLAQNCPLLEHLEIERNAKISYASIYSVLKHCKKIKQLIATHCKAIGLHNQTTYIENNAIHITNNVFPVLTEPREHLVFLSLSGCPKVNDLLLYNIGRVMPNLRRLSLTTFVVTDAGLAHLLSRCPELKHLSIDCDSKPLPVFTFETLVNLSKYNRKLEYLDVKVQKCSSEYYSALVAACPKLINVVGCTFVDGDGAERVVFVNQ